MLELKGLIQMEIFFSLLVAVTGVLGGYLLYKIIKK